MYQSDKILHKKTKRVNNIQYILNIFSKQAMLIKKRTYNHNNPFI